MFIHWGVYSLEGRGEWIMYQEHIPYAEYRQIAERFNPEAFNPAKWAALAKEAGMKYMIITTRHHDGYCLFDSKVSDLTSVTIGPHKDLIAAFADACHKAKMRMGFYYSLQDWHFPLASCASQADNLLLNVSPDGNSNIPEEQVEMLRKVGRRLELHGEAIYGARPSPVGAPNRGLQSRVGDKVYLLIQRWPGSTLPFAWCGGRLKSARVLTTGQVLEVEQKEDRVCGLKDFLNPHLICI